MILIADSSALVALSVMDSLKLLEPLFGKVYVPSAVYAEVTADLSLPESSALALYLKDKVYPLSDPSDIVLIDAYGDLGETEAMMLYKKLRADRLLIDDARGRRVAQVNEITVIGSLGILLLAKRKGFITQVAPQLKKLQASNVYVANKLIEQVLRLAGEQSL
jgi:predicted nucleic acid-binding protein